MYFNWDYNYQYTNSASCIFSNESNYMTLAIHKYILIVIVKYLNFSFYCMIKVDIKGPLLRLTTWVKIFNLFNFHKDSNVVSSKAWYPSYFINHFLKELSLSHKLKFTNSNIFATWIVLTLSDLTDFIVWNI